MPPGLLQKEVMLKKVGRGLLDFWTESLKCPWSVSSRAISTPLQNDVELT